MSIAPPSPPYLGPPNHHGGPGNRPIRRIVVHCTVGEEPGVKGAARGIASYFRRTTRYASAHYAADSRESVQCCWDSWVAYHAPPNEESIGYELCCSLSRRGLGHWGNADHKAMLQIAARDIARLCLAEGIPIRRVRAKALRAGKQGICGHIDVTNAWHQTDHWDPGPFFPWRKFIRMVREEAAKLTDGKPTLEETMAKLDQDDYDNIADAVWGKQLENKNRHGERQGTMAAGNFLTNMEWNLDRDLHPIRDRLSKIAAKLGIKDAEGN